MKKSIIIVFLLFFICSMYIIPIYATDTEEFGQVDFGDLIFEETDFLTPKYENIIVKAKVIEAGEVYEDTMPALFAGDEAQKVKAQAIQVQVLEGEYKDKVYDITYNMSFDLDGKLEMYPLKQGNKVFLYLTVENGEISQMVVQDIVRQNYIIYMVVIFFLMILAVGKKQGLKAIIGLIVTIVVIFAFMLKQIYAGHSPILISLISSLIIIVSTFAIIGGFRKKTITAAIGTMGGVFCSCVVGLIFGIVAKLSGFSEEALYLTFQNIEFNFRELLFAGIAIASLGACMDVGMSIASALDELKQKNPNMSGKELFKSGINIGSDIIGTMANTLILVYIGGTMNLVLLFMASDMTLVEMISAEIIATDIISALSGSMGVIFTVPITAIVYALFHKSHTEEKPKENDRVKGERSLKL